jgi:PKD repeat protein
VNPQAPDTGEEITLDAAGSTGDIESYEWQLPDGTASGQTTTATFEEAGDYEIQLTVTDTDGEVASTTQTVTVAVPVAASFTVTPTAPATDTEVTFDASESVGGIQSYEWSFIERTASGQTTTVTFGEAGEYEVQLTVTDAAGDTDMTSQTVSVARSLDETFDILAETLTTGEQIRFVAPDVFENPVEYRWDFQNDGNIDVTSEFPRATSTFENSGVTTVTLEIENSDGTVGRTSQEVSIRSSEINDVVNALVANAEALNNLAGPIGDDRTGQLRSQIETVRTRINEVENTSGETEQTQAARTITEFQELLLDHYVLSGEYATALDALISGIVTESISDVSPSELSNAASTLESAASETVPELSTNIAELQDTQGQLSETFGEEALDYSGNLNQYIIVEQTDGLADLAETFGQLATTIGDLFAGRAAFMNERWDEAADLFSSAEQTRADGAGMAEQLSDAVLRRAPTESAGVLRSHLGIFDLIDTDIATHIEIAELAADGDVETAQSRFDEATEALEEFAAPCLELPCP